MMRFCSKNKMIWLGSVGVLILFQMKPSSMKESFCRCGGWIVGAGLGEVCVW